MKNIFKPLPALAFLISLQAKAQAPSFTINTSSSYSITCANPTVNLYASSNYTAGLLTYSWFSSSGILSGTSIAVTNPGQYTVTAYASSTLSSTQTLVVGVNTVAPVSSLTPTTMNISCTVAIQDVTLSAVSPTVNVTHQVIPPQLVSFFVSTPSVGYQPGGPGTYTYVLRNEVNGCETTKQFSVTTADGYPSFTLTANQGYTLGCFSKSVTTVQIYTVTTSPSPGQPTSYQYLSPGSSTAFPGPGPSTQTITIPGTWTVCVKDNSNGCITRCPVSIIQYTAGPVIDAVNVSQPVLTCSTPTTTLKAITSNTNSSYNWLYTVGGNTLNYNGTTLLVNTNTVAPTSTIVGNYTLVLTDQVNLCKSTTVVTVVQNTFPPKAKINGTTFVISDSPINLTNGSTTNIPPPFPNSLPVLGSLWEGPGTQVPLQNSNIYIAQQAGVYTLTALDPNNGCTAKTTATVILISGLPEYGGAGNISDLISLQPNPCQGHLEVVLQMNTGEEVSVELLNLLGQKIKTLSSSHQERGETKIRCELAEINEGIYFVRLRSGNEAAVKKLIIAH